MKYGIRAISIIFFCMLVIGTASTGFAASDNIERYSYDYIDEDGNRISANITGGSIVEQKWQEAVERAKAEGSPIIEVDPTAPHITPYTYETASCRSPLPSNNILFFVNYDRIFNMFYRFGTIYNIDATAENIVRISNSTYTKIDMARTLACHYTLIINTSYSQHVVKNYYVEFTCSDNSGTSWND
mgnify:CR=1 FL=1